MTHDALYHMKNRNTKFYFPSHKDRVLNVRNIEALKFSYIIIKFASW